MPNYNKSQESARRLRQMNRQSEVRLDIRSDAGRAIRELEAVKDKLVRIDVPNPYKPIRGGRFLYCPWEQNIPGGIITCGERKVGWATGSRFRTEAAYRRHWRKHHS